MCGVFIPHGPRKATVIAMPEDEQVSKTKLGVAREFPQTVIDQRREVAHGGTNSCAGRVREVRLEKVEDKLNTINQLGRIRLMQCCTYVLILRENVDTVGLLGCSAESGHLLGVAQGSSGRTSRGDQREDKSRGTHRKEEEGGEWETLRRRRK